MQQGALLGAGVTMGVTVLSKIFMRLVFKKKKKQPKTTTQQQQQQRSPTPSNVSTPKTKSRLNANSSDVDFKAFGSPAFGSPTPVQPEVTPVMRPAGISFSTQVVTTSQEKKPNPLELDMDATRSHSNADQKGGALPPGQIKQQLQLLQEAQAENARLRSFMQQYMATSDKVKTLEEENAELKGIKTKLEAQLVDIASKSAINNGDELKSFKDSIRYHSIARSVYSDVDYGMRDNASVDGSASVIDAVAHKKVGALSQLFAWANTTAARTGTGPSSVARSPAPSQPSTPRGSRARPSEGGVASSDVVQLLNAFGGGIEL